jgi:hypothetical protein
MSHTPDQTALLNAFGQLLRPLARLALARGLPYSALDALLRNALVREARALHADTPAHGLTSRVSAATGLSRREVGRLLQDDAQNAPAARWLAGEVFAHWMGDPDFLQQGRPLRLPRQGAAPSFETLAQGVTRDVHPRTLLDELCRLGMACWHQEDDSVSLAHDALVPRADFMRMLALLADNVGDHLHAAVDNVLTDGGQHFEQAIYADELSPDSVQALRPLIAAQWGQLLQRLVPELEQRIADDRAQARAQDQRVRIGYYSFAEPMARDAPPRPAADDSHA